jgi:hypothetical protein
MRFRLLGMRRALALFVLGFCTTVFILMALAQGGAWARCFAALAAVYGVAFFALAAECFWGRWYAMGLAASGVTMAVLGLATSGWNAGLAIWGGIHLLIYGPLLGEAMADRYENQEAWRKRYGLDEYGVARLKRAVKGAATALPTLIFFTLAPREGASLWAFALPLAVAAGLYGLVRMRTWGLVVLGLGALWAAAGAAAAAQGATPFVGGSLGLSGLALVGAAFLFLAVSPFVVPAYRMLREPR